VKITAASVPLTDIEGAHEKIDRATHGHLFEVVDDAEGRLQVALPFTGGTAWLPAASAAPWPR
jgi:hypothetical protein